MVEAKESEETLDQIPLLSKSKKKGKKKDKVSKSQSLKSRNSSLGLKVSGEAISMTDTNANQWNLEVEIAKVIEKVVSLGVDLKGSKEFENGNDYWNLEVEIAKVKGSKGKLLFAKANTAKVKMKKWIAAGSKAGSSTKALESKLAELEDISKRDIWTQTIRDEQLQVISDLWKALRLEEYEWKQKSHIKWLMEGDKNTCFLHNVSNKSHLLNSKISSIHLKKLSTLDRKDLEREFSEEEVYEALFNYDGNKASSLDGLNMNFTKANWETIKLDFMNFLSEFHRDSLIVKKLNSTFITLIPKISNPVSPNDYRSISLVGSLYKLLAKVLANQLKKVMNSIIGDSQMAFIINQQIMDSFVIANEIIHS
ncbi:hypothetical protein Dsin_016362 [Dipteronia sinensis]|uniref:Reverse transcriptase domain-containing protein n=1 Tax=Dipteronia sinensis TaxID=43782 RepID=A0AAE0E5E8_9ROSI|nr:hypothetical protein Dsin_016362 [Dipteronia sinensis]